MRSRFFMLVGSILLVVALIGCGRPSVTTSRDTPYSLEIPEQLTLYSIDGRDFKPGEEPKTEEKLHGYPVLGKVDIKDAEQRKEIIAALNEGLARGDKGAACFWPRHAIRTVNKGRIVDYVICFECMHLIPYVDGSATRPIGLDRSPQPILNRYLEEAGILLAPLHPELRYLDQRRSR
jgi:hypothetical protein